MDNNLIFGIVGGPHNNIIHVEYGIPDINIYRLLTYHSLANSISFNPIYDVYNFAGFHLSEPLADCASLMADGYITSSDYYLPARSELGVPLKRVWCDMTTDGGG